MTRRSWYLVAVVAAAAFVGIRFAHADPDKLKDKPAPAFSLKTTEGKPAKLSDQKGKVVLIDFWATWCPPCRASLPHIQKLAADTGKAKEGLVVWAVNAREAKDVIEKFTKSVKNNYTFTVPMDLQGTVMENYGVEGIPTTVVVGRDGVVRNVFVGYNNDGGKTVDAAVEAALKESAPK